MKPAFLFYLRIFFLMGLAYGGIHALIFYFFGDGEPWLIRSVILGAGFGLVMGLFHTYKQVREVKKLRGTHFTTEDLSVQQAAHFQSPLTTAQILEKLQNQYPSKDWELTEEAGLIKIKTTYSWRSFGEKVRIRVDQLQNGLSEVFVESKPRT